MGDTKKDTQNHPERLIREWLINYYALMAKMIREHAFVPD
jgi:hypothetical protein